MNIDLIALKQKLVNSDFVGFTLAEDAGKAVADKTCNGKLGVAKLALTKLGITKTGLSRA